MNLLKDNLTMRTPQFQENEPYARFIKRFKVFLMRDTECNFVLNGVPPPEAVTPIPGEKAHVLQVRARELETKKTA